MPDLVEIAGFVDHHTHLLRVATETASPCDYTDPSAIAEYHRRIAAAGSTPMDEPPGPVGAANVAGAIAGWLTRAGRLGLVGMGERVRLLGGHFDIESKPGGPTRVRATIPRWQPLVPAESADAPG